MLWSFASPLNAAHLLSLRIWKKGLVSLYNQMDMYIGLGLNSREVDGFIPTLEPCAFEIFWKVKSILSHYQLH